MDSEEARKREEENAQERERVRQEEVDQRQENKLADLRARKESHSLDQNERNELADLEAKGGQASQSSRSARVNQGDSPSNDGSGGGTPGSHNPNKAVRQGGTKNSGGNSKE